MFTKIRNGFGSTLLRGLVIVGCTLPFLWDCSRDSSWESFEEDANDDATVSGNGASTGGTTVTPPGGTTTTTEDSDNSNSNTNTNSNSNSNSNSNTNTTVNVAPTVVNDTYTLDLSNNTALDVLANDSDSENETLTLTAVSSGSNSATIAISSNKVTYSPATNFSGSDTFTYTVSDGNDTATGSVTITVSPATLSTNKTSPSATAATTYASTATITYTITNGGSTTATSLSFSGLSGDWSGSSGTCTTSLAASASCTYVATFTSPGDTTIDDTLAVAFNNGYASTSISTISRGTGAAIALTVADVYSSNAKWNDYIKNNDSSKDAYHQSDTACDVTDTDYHATCIHGGEKRKVPISGVASCGNTSASDALGIFNWVCQVDTGTATFFTNGLKNGKRLADLVNATSFKDNTVTVVNGSTTVGSSVSTTWHANTVSALPADTGSVQTLSTESIIYTVAADATAEGYNIQAKKVAIVVFDGAKLGYAGSASANCNTSTGGTGTDQICLLAAGNYSHLWIEGDLDGEGGANDAYYTVFLSANKHSRLHHLSVMRATVGIQLNSVNGLLATRVKAMRHTNDGLRIESSSKNVLSEISANNSNRCIFFRSSSDNIVTRAIFSACQYGVRLLDTSDVYSVRNTFAFITVANNSTYGVHAQKSDNLTFSQILAVNSTKGFGFNISDNHNVGHIVASNNTSTGFDFVADSTGNVFTGNLLLGDNGQDCTVSVTSDGMKSSPTNAGRCENSASSSANIVDSTLNPDPDLTLVASLQGKVTTSDSSNSSDTLGTETFDNIVDWTHFESFFRSWGKDGSAFANTDHTNACVTSETCRIWDWRISSSDSKIYKKSNDGSASNSAFSDGVACPGAVSGSKIIADDMTTSNTFLLNAMEIIGDSIGDDNGLCESDEACIYAPHYGAYQDEGDYLSQTCTFSDGTVSGVTMYSSE